MLLNVFVCNVLLQNAYNNQQKYVRKTDENGPQMVPNLSKIDPGWGSGGHLGATLEARRFQDIMFDDFGSTVGPHLGTSVGSFLASFLFVFF